jgi:phosphoribosyl-ATP pyrophosphohydrolase/phosphoribosyl-AMP cyclohydrolase
MSLPPAGADALPLVVLAAGKVRAVGRMNRKGCAKSLAEGRLWTLHADTGRLLPFEAGGRLLRLVERPGFYEAELDAAAEPGPAAEPGTAATAGASAATAGASAAPAAAPDVLLRLAELIARRRREMPEGSYTTHLFEEGTDKIRKKLGEEAVELILAGKPSELVYESADLIYHLLVLLEAYQVLAELERRADAG